MSDSMEPRIYVETIDGVTVARFVDSEILAEEVIRGVDGQLHDLLEGLGTAEVLLNFQGVRLMSSTVLAILLKLSRRVEKAGGKIKLCSIAPALRDVFKITRFDRLFEIYAEEWSALDSFHTRHSAPLRG